MHSVSKYHCFQCNFKATQKSNLNVHRRSVHEGIKYPCDQCEYKATLKYIRGQYIKELDIHVINVSIKLLNQVISRDTSSQYMRV